jgi:hypothetical protein
MKNEEEQKDKRREVDKLLKGLQKVQASPDFEERLHRRIAETAAGRPAGGWWIHVFGPRRIPALAYSLATLVLVGIVSYYAFFRSGNVPTPQQSLNEIPASTQGTGAEPSSGKADDRRDQSEAAERTLTAPAAPPGAQSAQPQLRQKQGRTDLRDESTANQPAVGKDAIESGNAAQDLKKEQAAPQTGVPVPVPPVTQGAQPQLQEWRSNAAAVQEYEAKEQHPPIPSQSLLKQLQVREPSDAGKQKLSIEQQLKYVTEKIDSLGSGDSLKMDSLRQLQRYLQMQQRKAKIRKPDSE